MKLNEDWLQEDGLFKCPFCDKKFSKKGITSHIWRKHEKGINHKPTLNKKRKNPIWNKGLTKETSDLVKKYSNTIRKNGNKSFLGKKHSDITKQKISEKLSVNNKGGRCKFYEVKNNLNISYKVQGTWELNFTNYLNTIDDNWIKLGINNKNHSFKWIDDLNKQHTYTPDFYSPKLNKYFEIKGFWWGNDKLKMIKVLEQNKINLEIVTKEKYYEYIKK